MSTLSRENRRLLENTVAQARAIVEEGARKVLRDQYAVHHHEPWPHMTTDDRKLRNQLRAHGRQFGDSRDPKRETQEIEHLVQACAYEHWHRMLFARFLAENDLLLDAQHGVAMTLDDIRELAREQGRDWMEIAAELAQRMLLAVFRPDDPVLKIQLPPETRQQLEAKLGSLPLEVFQADDSLGWVYQFWQSKEKDRINDSGVKIGADELPAVTELFTEDYMVWFLLHNTLGAWWTAKRKAEGKDTKLPGYEWRYLRLKEDGTPAAGSFDGWPRWARDIKLLDPSMGSGHFLVFALPILVAFRMEEEGLTHEDALEAVLRENLFGLEIDPRCTQIAAFNLAWTAWRMVGYRPLPQLNLACTGLGINAKEEDWVKLAGKDEPARETMRRLYHLFEQAPVLGSLIDPKRVGGQLFTIEFEKVRPLLEQALRNEQEHEETVELAVAAQGLLQATRLLAHDFTLVATNVPYLEQRKQAPTLREYCARNHPSAKGDLATAFIERIKRSTANRGALAVVTPQNWLFLTTYKRLRETLLKDAQWRLLALLGPQAFETISGHVVKPVLLILENDKAEDTTEIRQLDVSGETTPTAKSLGLIRAETLVANQLGMLRNPDARVTFGIDQTTPKLQHYCSCLAGIMNGDSPHYQRLFWEVTAAQSEWVFQQTTVSHTVPYGGLEKLIYFDEENGHLRADAEFRREQLHNSDERGNEAWGRKGIAVSQTGDLPISMYLGNKFDSNVAAVVPHNIDDLPALWAYLSSPDFSKQVRKLDPKLNVTNATIGQVPFDRAHWAAAAKCLPQFPAPSSTDPTQWIFTGQPRESQNPLQVGVARLLGYRWPRQTGSSFLDCPALEPDGLEKHADTNGVVPLNAIAGAASAGHRLRGLLADAYGDEWSAAKLQELLGNWDSLEDWLRDGFFEEHCRIFCQRPIIWHVWDGRKDGFHALVNYHVMAAPNGEGGQTLEKLIYTYLGRWIERQSDEVRAGKEGADARLSAATHLKTELENILRGEKPYDIFVRWKPLHEQPIGWEPDINDGVRLNIRPWLTARVYQPSRRDGCILRVTPRIPFGKDRGNEPHRLKDDSPWFWTWDGRSDDFMGGGKFDGARWNDPHYSLARKKEARDAHKTEVTVYTTRKA